MLQITRSPQVFDVVVVGSGAGGGTAVKVLTDLGINVALLEAGPMLNPAKDFKEHVTPYQVDHRGAGPHAEMYFGRQQWGYLQRAQRLLGIIHGEPYTVAQRQRVPLVPLAHHGRPHQPLRPHLAALLRLRFQALLIDGLGNRLARHLRRNVALVRQGRGLHRRHRHEGRHAHRARRQFPAAHPAARARGADPERVQETRHPRASLRAWRCSPSPSTAAPPATIAGNADADARPLRRSPPARP